LTRDISYDSPLAIDTPDSPWYRPDIRKRDNGTVISYVDFDEPTVAGALKHPRLTAVGVFDALDKLAGASTLD
jgi:hypothetical protein